MNQDWQQFLTQQGATIDAGVVQHFGDAGAELSAAAHGDVVCDLSQFGMLRAVGEDTQAFLQSMLSNDIREVNANRAQLSSLNSPKGRMLASMMICNNGVDYLLQLPKDMSEPIRKKLGMYVLRAKVKITSVSDEVVSLGLSGSNAGDILRAIFGEVPQQPMDFTLAGQTGLLKFSDTRFQIVTDVQRASELWQKLGKDARAVGSSCWDWLNIRDGIPVILPQTQEQFVPQMVNFELLGGINFKKGCYPGQEIVARMQYLGKTKRRMYLAHIASTVDGEVPQPGDELCSTDMEGQASGMIANVAPAPGGGYDMLVVTQSSSRKAQSIHWKSLQGAALQFLDLPYSLPVD